MYFLFLNDICLIGKSESALGLCRKCKENVVEQGIRCSSTEGIYHIKCFTCDICNTPLKGKSIYNLENKLICEDDYINTLDKCCVCRKPITDRILKADGKLYHTNCFTCYVCGKCLNGLPYSVDEDNHNYCVDDYRLKFSPICSVCEQPIIPESGQTQAVRIIADEKNFHISCFKCGDCGLLFSSNGEDKAYYPFEGDILCRDCITARIEKIE
jgi:hypothetical protein